MKTCVLMCIVLAAPGVLQAAEPQEGPVPQSVFQPLSAQERWRNYATDSFLSPGPLFASVMPALGEQRRHQPPEYGDGWEGFARRLWRRTAQYQLTAALHHASAAALGTETGYRRCDCSATKQRFGYALSRAFLTRTRSGKTVANVAFLGGVIAGNAIATETWYPDRYRATGEGVRAAALQVGVATAVNVVQEFGPELKRLFRR